MGGGGKEANYFVSGSLLHNALCIGMNNIALGPSSTVVSDKVGVRAFF